MVNMQQRKSAARNREKRKPSGCRREGGAGGARRDRTADLLHAMQALSQLSYGPTRSRRNLRSGAGVVKQASRARTAPEERHTTRIQHVQRPGETAP